MIGAFPHRGLHEHVCPMAECRNSVWSTEPNTAGHRVVDWLICWDHSPQDVTVVAPFGESPAGW